jgi:lipid A 3-O-deacylase
VNKFIGLIVGAVFFLTSTFALAIDGVSLEFGSSDSSNSSVNMYRVGVQWDWKKHLIEAGNWNLGGYWDLSGGYWDNRSPLRTDSQLTEIGFTPTFRFQQNTISGFSPYAEIAVGFHFLSRTSVSSERKFGSSFQFGDHVGAGFRFGDKGEYDIGYRYQHLSNAGIKEPNQGINFHQLRLQYHF